MRMMTPTAYQAKQFGLGGLKGISDQTLALHSKLYERYIREPNRLTQSLDQYPKGSQVGQDEIPYC